MRIMRLSTLLQTHLQDEVHDVEGSDKKVSLFKDLTQTGTDVRMTVLKNLVPMLRIASKSRNATGAVRNLTPDSPFNFASVRSQLVSTEGPHTPLRRRAEHAPPVETRP